MNYQPHKFFVALEKGNIYLIFIFLLLGVLPFLVVHIERLKKQFDLDVDGLMELKVDLLLLLIGSHVSQDQVACRFSIPHYLNCLRFKVLPLKVHKILSCMQFL